MRPAATLPTLLALLPFLVSFTTAKPGDKSITYEEAQPKPPLIPATAPDGTMVYVRDTSYEVYANSDQTSGLWPNGFSQRAKELVFLASESKEGKITFALQPYTGMAPVEAGRAQPAGLQGHWRVHLEGGTESICHLEAVGEAVPQPHKVVRFYMQPWGDKTDRDILFPCGPVEGIRVVCASVEASCLQGPGPRWKSKGFHS